METNFEAILTEAREAAETAIRNADDSHGCGPCGFAWVSVKPARGKFVNFCRSSRDAMSVIGEHRAARNYGDNGYPTGWDFWMPGRDATRHQGIHLFEAGASAFASVLMRHGIKCQVGSRLD